MASTLNNKIILFVVVIVIIVVVIILYNNNNNNVETFAASSSQNAEAIANVESLYKAGNFTVTNINATNRVDVGNGINVNGYTKITNSIQYEYTGGGLINGIADGKVNKWMIHLPNSGTNKLMIVPAKADNPNEFNWASSTEFFNDGSVTFNGPVNFNKPITVSSAVNIASNDNKKKWIAHVKDGGQDTIQFTPYNNGTPKWGTGLYIRNDGTTYTSGYAYIEGNVYMNDYFGGGNARAAINATSNNI
jgi:hypothetical protein